MFKTVLLLIGLYILAACEQAYEVTTMKPINNVSDMQYTNNLYQLELLESVGHYPMLEKPDIFNRLFGKILFNYD